MGDLLNYFILLMKIAISFDELWESMVGLVGAEREEPTGEDNGFR